MQGAQEQPIKSHAIRQPPQLLTLHLKRFEQVHTNVGVLCPSVNHPATRVSLDQFPGVGALAALRLVLVCFSFQLDVTQYLSQSGASDPPGVAAAASGNAPSGRQQAEDVPAEHAEGCSCPAADGGSTQQRAAAVRYQLVGLVEHSGTMR